MGNFYTDFLVTSPLFHSVDRVSSLEYLEPSFRSIIEVIIEEAGELGHDMVVYETYRSAQRQSELFAQHATQLKVVGCHHYGLACDIVKAGPSWEGDFYFLGRLANFHGLVWGGPGAGNLNIGDMDHVQMCAFVDQNRLFAGHWYPDDNYVARGVA
jgi:hypothetical protein